VSRLRLRPSALIFVGVLALSALAAIVISSRGVVYLVTEYRWAMYSLFVGLTLGGAPELWRLAGGARATVLVSILAGFGGMWLFTMSGQNNLPETWLVFTVVGAAAAASMILPGISGAYVLLIFGMYETVIGSASTTALREDPRSSLFVLGFVGLGAALGIALLSNLLKWLLRTASGPTHGVLMGLLLGSVLGLWPFQEPVHPHLAHPVERKAIEDVVLKGLPFDEARENTGVEWTDDEFTGHVAPYRGLSKTELKRRSSELRPVRVDPGRGAIAFALLAVGFATTALLARSGRTTATGTG
jgi:putative membrane protein